jgi:hypothetical protein
MRYISLMLGRSGHGLQEWARRMGPLKEMDLRTGSRPVPVAVQVHSRKPPAYKPLYKLRGLSYRSCPSPVTTLLLVGELDG